MCRGLEGFEVEAKIRPTVVICEGDRRERAGNSDETLRWLDKAVFFYWREIY